MPTPPLFPEPLRRDRVEADVRRALTRALREGLTLDELRQLVADHLRQCEE